MQEIQPIGEQKVSKLTLNSYHNFHFKCFECSCLNILQSKENSIVKTLFMIVHELCMTSLGMASCYACPSILPWARS